METKTKRFIVKVVNITDKVIENKVMNFLYVRRITVIISLLCLMIVIQRFVIKKYQDRHFNDKIELIIVRTMNDSIGKKIERFEHSYAKHFIDTCVTLYGKPHFTKTEPIIYDGKTQ